MIIEAADLISNELKLLVQSLPMQEIRGSSLEEWFEYAHLISYARMRLPALTHLGRNNSDSFVAPLVGGDGICSVQCLDMQVSQKINRELMQSRTVRALTTAIEVSGKGNAEEGAEGGSQKVATALGQPNVKDLIAGYCAEQRTQTDQAQARWPSNSCHHRAPRMKVLMLAVQR